jgi:hypothetical protein
VLLCPLVTVAAELSLIEPQWHGGGAFGPLVLGDTGPGGRCAFGESTLQAVPLSPPFSLQCDLSLNVSLSADVTAAAPEPWIASKLGRRGWRPNIGELV